MSERKTLLESLKDEVVKYSSRKTVGRMKTEFSIFIPTELMRNQAEETKTFISAAKDIKRDKVLGCSVQAEPKESGSLSGAGIEFIFEFTEETDFDGIIGEIEDRLAND